MCWQKSGPVLDGLNAAGIPCEETICSGDSVSRITWILEQLRKNPVDVFVPNLVVPAFYAARWVRSAGIPTVGVLHSDDDFYRAVQDEFAIGDQRLALSSLVAVSEEIERQVAEKAPAKTNVIRIPYGVPMPDRIRQRAAGQLKIAYVGRLAEEQKRISEVTKSFCRLVKEVPGSSASIFGDGPDRQDVERILAEQGSGLSVKLVGRVDSSQMQDYLLEHDVIVLLSDYEGLPIAILEAMACGVVPVCLEMRSGIPELVEHDVTGLVVQDRGDDFVAAIRRLKDNTELWTKLSSNARDRVRDENSVAACAKQWAVHLTELATESKPSTIRIPSRLDLPPVNPAFQAEDPRTVTPSALSRTLQRTRQLAARLRRVMRPAKRSSEDPQLTDK